MKYNIKGIIPNQFDDLFTKEDVIQPGNDNTISSATPWLGQGTLHNYANQRNMDSRIGHLLPDDYGESKFDQNIPWRRLTEGDQSLEDIRANRQSAAGKLGNSAVNMLAIAGTTFADSFIGTAAGLLQLGYQSLLNATSDEEDINWAASLGDAFVNNWYSKNVTFGLQNAVADAFKIHTSDQYRANRELGQWYKNMGDVAFWAEGLTSVGFTLGAVGAGAVSGLAFAKMTGAAAARNAIQTAARESLTTAQRASKDVAKYVKQAEKAIINNPTNWGKELANHANSLKWRGAATNILSNAVAVAGESRIEGIHTSDEFKQNMMQELNSEEVQQSIHNDIMKDLSMTIYDTEEEYQNAYNQIYNQRMSEAMNSIDKNAKRVAAVTFSLNAPILAISNMVMFKNLFRKSYTGNRGFLSAIRDGLEGSSGNMTLEGAGRIGGEIGQYALKGTGKAGYIGQGAYTIIKNALSEGMWEEMGQNAVSMAAKDYVNDSIYLGYVDPDKRDETYSLWNSILKSYEETFTNPEHWEEGFFGAVIGAGGVVTVGRNRKGGTGLTWQGGVIGEAVDRYYDNKALESVTKELNTFDKKNIRKIYADFLTTNRELTDKERDAIIEDDKIKYDNAQTESLINMFITFNKADKLDDILDTIDIELESVNKALSSPNNVEMINDIVEDLKEVMGITVEGKNINPFKGLSNEAILLKHKKNLEGIKKKYTNFLDISNNLREMVGDKFDQKGLESLTFLATQLRNIDTEYANGLTEIDEVLSKTSPKDDKTKLQKFRYYTEELVEDEKSKELKEQREGKTITFEELLKTPASELINILSTMPKEDKVNFNALLKKSNPTETDKFKKALANNLMLKGLSTRFAEKYNKFLGNPEEIEKETIQKEQAVKELKDIAEAVGFVNAISNTKKYEEVLSEINKLPEDKRDNILKVTADNPFVKKYLDRKEKVDKFNEVGRTVTTTPAIRDLAKSILKDRLDNGLFDDILGYLKDKEIPKNMSKEDIEALKKFFNTVNKKIRTAATGIDKDGKNIAPLTKDGREIIEGDPANNFGDVTKENSAFEEKQTELYTVNDKDNYLGTANLTGYVVRNRQLEDKPLSSTDNFLENEGAKAVRDNNSVKAGDEVYFIIWPEYQSTSKPEIKESDAIFMAVKRGNKYQPIDTLSGMANVQALRDRVIKEYKDNKEAKEKEESAITNTTTYVKDTPVWVSKEKTTVQFVKNGQVKFTEEETDLNSLDLVKINEKTGKKYIPSRISFGISLNTRFNKMRDNETWQNFKDIAGRLYLGLRGGKGEFMPLAVRVQKLSELSTQLIGRKEQIFNGEVMENPTFVEEALLALRDFAHSLENINVNRDAKEVETDFRSILSKLNNYFRIGNNANHRANFVEIDGEWRLTIKGLDDNHKWVEKAKVLVRRENNELNAYLLDNLYEYFTRKGDTKVRNIDIGFSIGKDELKRQDYVIKLIESGILSTNISSPAVHGINYVLNPLDEKGNIIGKTPEVKQVTVRNPMGNNTESSLGNKVTPKGTKTREFLTKTGAIKETSDKKETPVVKSFNSKDKTLKAGSVINYKGKKALVRRVNAAGRLQLIDDNGERLPGTPLKDNKDITVQGNYKIVEHNSTDYIVTDKGNIYSTAATGRTTVYSEANDGNRKIIYNKAGLQDPKSIVEKPKVTLFDDEGNLNEAAYEDKQGNQYNEQGVKTKSNGAMDAFLKDKAGKPVKKGVNKIESKEQPTLEQQKADIERRRQEEFERQKLLTEKIKTAPIITLSKDEQVLLNTINSEINAKYDAELAALEQQSKQQQAESQISVEEFLGEDISEKPSPAKSTKYEGFSSATKEGGRKQIFKVNKGKSQEEFTFEKSLEEMDKKEEFTRETKKEDCNPK